ncbi:MAG: Sec7 domain-containing protein [Gammaproteobacteria bacterium]
MKSGIDVSKLDEIYSKPKIRNIPQVIPNKNAGYFSMFLDLFRPPVTRLVRMADFGNEDHARLIACFNRNPNKTISKWLKDLNLEEQIQSIHWLITEHPGLISAEKVGELLSEPSSETIAWSNGLLESYLNTRFDFKGKSIVDCFSEFLKADFKLPGEAQKIDRMMSGFSKKYLSDNPDCTQIEDRDAAYVLSFSMIMLNTDLHNPNVAKSNKMSFEAFARNLSGVNKGGDFKAPFLRHIYDYINQNPLIWDRASEVQNQVESDFEQLKPLSAKFDSNVSQDIELALDTDVPFDPDLLAIVPPYVAPIQFHITAADEDQANEQRRKQRTEKINAKEIRVDYTLHS